MKVSLKGLFLNVRDGVCNSSCLKEKLDMMEGVEESLLDENSLLSWITVKVEL